jgi:glycosyltransferase involved in cell wall biosynthesis
MENEVKLSPSRTRQKRDLSRNILDSVSQLRGDPNNLEKELGHLDLDNGLHDLSIVEVHNKSLTVTSVLPLASFLSQTCGRFVHIQHQVAQTVRKSTADVYVGGNHAKCLTVKYPHVSAILSPFLTLPISLFFMFRLRLQFDFFIAGDELNSFLGIILGKLRKVKYVVFYSQDYFPIRFNGHLANGAFRLLEALSVKNSDFVWVVSDRMMKIRKAQGARTVYLTSGASLDTSMNDLSKIERKVHQLAYVGYLGKEKGIDLALKSLPHLIPEFPDIKLVVVGDGPQRGELLQTTESLGIQSHVQFLGLMRRSEFGSILRESSIGVATYRTDEHAYAFYAFPTKVVEYISNGLPVVLTKAASIWKEVVESGAGLCVNYDQSEFVQAVRFYLRDEAGLKIAGQRALELSGKYDFRSTIRGTLSETLRHSNVN